MRRADRSGTGTGSGARPVVLVLGATSGIGRGIAAAFARRGYDPYVTSRHAADAERAAQDLTIRYGVTAGWGAFDATRPESHRAFFSGVVETHGDCLAGVIAAFGVLGDQGETQRDPDAAVAVITANYTGLVSILTLAANQLERRRRGFLVGLGSVAGDRGRQSNYVYGSSKGAMAIFLAGLRNRLHGVGVRVVTVKPGFVDTEMTYGLPGMFLVADPEQIGEGVARAVERGRDVVYLPWIWRYIMLCVRLIPERLFKRLAL